MPSHRKKRVGHVNDDDDDNEISDESMEQVCVVFLSDKLYLYPWHAMTSMSDNIIYFVWRLL